MAKGHITKLETKTLNKKMTTTTTNTNNNTQQQRTPEEEKKLRDRWDDRVTGALFRQLKRKVRAANAVFGSATPEWVSYDPEATWFTASCDRDVTRHAALAEECLDDARAHAKRKGWTPIPLEDLQRGILESEALEPYLKRWKRDNYYEAAAAAAAVAAAPTRARCAYPLMD